MARAAKALTAQTTTTNSCFIPRIHKSQQYAAGVMPYHPVYSGYGDKGSYCLLLNPLKKIGKWSAKKTWAKGVKQRNFPGTIFNLCFNIHSLRHFQSSHWVGKAKIPEWVDGMSVSNGYHLSRKGLWVVEKLFLVFLVFQSKHTG